MKGTDFLKNHKTITLWLDNPTLRTTIEYLKNQQSTPICTKIFIPVLLKILRNGNKPNVEIS